MNAPRIGRISPKATGAAPLDVVIAIMSFLAALALGASLVADRAADSWRAGLAGRITVQILPPANGTAAALAGETQAAADVLRNTDGIVAVSPLSEKDIQELVEPWIGRGNFIADLPLPRLIDATLVPGAHVDMERLAARLKQAAPDSLLDDHTRWIGRLKGLADGIVLSAYVILALIAVATASAVAFATRAGLDAHHDIVALLHQMGARAGFISGAFDRHYFVSALGSAAAGAFCAAMLFAAAQGLQMAGVEAVPFLPPMGLHLSELAWLAAIPAGAGMIAWATARISVLAAVSRIY